MGYNRILLKLSGESLQGEQKYGLSTAVLHSYAEQIKKYSVISHSSKYYLSLAKIRKNLVKSYIDKILITLFANYMQS